MTDFDLKAINEREIYEEWDVPEGAHRKQYVEITPEERDWLVQRIEELKEKVEAIRLRGECCGPTPTAHLETIMDMQAIATRALEGKSDE